MATMHTLQPDFQVFKDIVYGMDLFNMSWIVYIILIVMTILLITRNTQRFGILLLPVIVMYAQANVTTVGAMFYALITLSAVVFAVKAISMQHAGTVLKAVAKTVTFGYKPKKSIGLSSTKQLEQYKDQKFLERLKFWKLANEQPFSPKLDRKLTETKYGKGYLTVDEFLNKRKDDDITNY